MKWRRFTYVHDRRSPFLHCLRHDQHSQVLPLPPKEEFPKNLRGLFWTDESGFYGNGFGTKVPLTDTALPMPLPAGGSSLLAQSFYSPGIAQDWKSLSVCLPKSEMAYANYRPAYYTVRDTYADVAPLKIQLEDALKLSLPATTKQTLEKQLQSLKCGYTFTFSDDTYTNATINNNPAGLTYTFVKQTPPAGKCPPAPGATKDEISECADWRRDIIASIGGTQKVLTTYYIWQIVDEDGNPIHPAFDQYVAWTTSVARPDAAAAMQTAGLDLTAAGGDQPGMAFHIEQDLVLLT